MQNGSRSNHSLNHGIYALVDDTLRADLPLLAKAEALLSGGVRTLQLRLKRTPAHEAVEVAKALAWLVRQAGAQLIINDRVDWALLADAAGVHLGADDLPVSEARKLLGPGKLIGATVRNLADIRAAAEQGADYVGLGPVFATRTKVVDAPVLGLAGLRAIASECPVPVVAISGINLSNVAQVAAQRVHAAAVGSALLEACDIAAAARELAGEFARGQA
jgi:thiamine-phosphate pyrophosphorylase